MSMQHCARYMTFTKSVQDNDDELIWAEIRAADRVNRCATRRKSFDKRRARPLAPLEQETVSPAIRPYLDKIILRLQASDLEDASRLYCEAAEVRSGGTPSWAHEILPHVDKFPAEVVQTMLPGLYREQTGATPPPDALVLAQPATIVVAERREAQAKAALNAIREARRLAGARRAAAVPLRTEPGPVYTDRHGNLKRPPPTGKPAHWKTRLLTDLDTEAFMQAEILRSKLAMQRAVCDCSREAAAAREAEKLLLQQHMSTTATAPLTAVNVSDAASSSGVAAGETARANETARAKADDATTTSGDSPEASSVAASASPSVADSTATSQVSLESTLHSRVRLEERQLRKRQLQAAKKHAPPEAWRLGHLDRRTGRPRWLVEWEGVVLVTDPDRRMIITCWAATRSEVGPSAQ